MSRARKASAATSLPNAGAFTPAGIGRSRAAISALARARRGGGAPRAAIGASGVEAERGQPALNLLHLGERGGTLSARELLHERAAAAQAVGEMGHRQRVAERRVVAHQRGEVLPEQEARAAAHRQGETGAVAWAPESRPVRARDTEIVPLGKRAPRGPIGEPLPAARNPDFAAPCPVAAGKATPDEVSRRTGPRGL